MNKEIGNSTRSVHLCTSADEATGAILRPIYQNAAFSYRSVDQWEAVALEKQPGHIYSRNTNPTSEQFEKKMAALEKTECATSFATGMAAVNTTLFALLRPGQRVITVRDAYGATYLHFTKILPEFNIECRICNTDDLEEIKGEIKNGCDLLYLESPTNPLLKILDLELLTKSARKQNAVVVVDNTFATPINQNPADFDVDVIIHSATKYLGGHGDVLGGVACGKKEIIDNIFKYRELTGPALDANSAYLLLRSLKTLGLRVQQQNANALTLARFLQSHKEVSRVFYPGLERHPGHEIAKKQMKGFGGVLSFELQGGFEAVKRFLPALRYAYMSANLGQVETIVGPPATTSHVECSEEERKTAGIPEGLIRFAIGIEDIEDIKLDVSQALGKA